MFACPRGDKLIEDQLSIQALHNEAILSAAKHGHLDMVKLFLDKGANIEARCNNDNTPLLLASRYGHLDMVKLLINEGADIKVRNIYGMRSLDIASIHKHKEVVKLPINSIEANDNYLIVQAAKKGVFQK